MKLTDADVAESYVPSDAIDALSVHVPAVTKVTTAVEESIVQTLVVELEYERVPDPAEGLLASVGAAADLL